MKRIIAVALVALAICVAIPSVASAKLCSAGYVHAIVGHAQKCLRRGEYCAVRYERQYIKYGYICEIVGGSFRLEPS